MRKNQLERRDIHSKTTITHFQIDPSSNIDPLNVRRECKGKNLRSGIKKDACGLVLIVLIKEMEAEYLENAEQRFTSISKADAAKYVAPCHNEDAIEHRHS